MKFKLQELKYKLQEINLQKKNNHQHKKEEDKALTNVNRNYSKIINFHKYLYKLNNYMIVLMIRFKQ